jgi:hypothetical protein
LKTGICPNWKKKEKKNTIELIQRVEDNLAKFLRDQERKDEDFAFKMRKKEEREAQDILEKQDDAQIVLKVKHLRVEEQIRTNELEIEYKTFTPEVTQGRFKTGSEDLVGKIEICLRKIKKCTSTTDELKALIAEKNSLLEKIDKESIQMMSTNNQFENILTASIKLSSNLIEKLSKLAPEGEIQNGDKDYITVSDEWKNKRQEEVKRLERNTLEASERFAKYNSLDESVDLVSKTKPKLS